MKFQLKIENFEGPIDALLQMIEKRKMIISDISLADIADEYIQFVSTLEQESLSDITHFIFVASTLTLIKSKSLLPNLELTEEEEGDIEDLKKRIEIFKIFQSASLKLKQQFLSQPLFYYSRPRKKEIQFSPDKNINTGQIYQSLVSVLHEIPEKTPRKKEATVRIAIHIEDMMISLEKRIKNSMQTNFSDFIADRLGDKKEKKAVKVYKVVGFLAMLELVKNGVLGVLQKHNFDTINIASLENKKDTNF